MDSTSTGALVKVGGSGPELDGIVFDVPSRAKVVVAVLDPSRGPVLRTVHATSLSERAEEAPGDRALRLLIRRTPAPTRGAAAAGKSAGRGSAGHSRTAMHRTTGK